MAQKPDRFERIVMKYIDKGIPDYDGCILTDREVVKLLRRQHRAYVRIVKKAKAGIFFHDAKRDMDKLIAAFDHYKG